MSVILDVIISMIMGGMLLLNILRAQDIVAENTSEYQGDVLVQEMLITQVQYIEGEFRNMGYGVPPGKQTILAADTSSITFLTDLDRDGTLDTLTYSLGPFGACRDAERDGQVYPQAGQQRGLHGHRRS